MNKLTFKIAGLVFVSLLFSGCVKTIENFKLNFNPQEPLRIAVLPFISVNKDGSENTGNESLLVDSVPLLSEEVKKTPPEIVRQLVLAELARSGLEIISPTLIDLDLPHHGFATSSGELDLKKLRNTDPKELCRKFLDCEAVMYGEVTEWDRSYYGIQSVNIVGIKIKIVSARDASLLYEAQVTDSHSRGLTKGPTGLSSIVLEPIKGLDSELILDLAEKVVEKAITPLRVDTRLTYHDTPPPVIFAATHDGEGRIVTQKNPLIVLVFGSEKMFTSFSVGNNVRDIPMIEINPGHYYGEFVPFESDRIENEVVTVTIRDQHLRSMTQPVPVMTVRTQ